MSLMNILQYFLDKHPTVPKHSVGRVMCSKGFFLFFSLSAQLFPSSYFTTILHMQASTENI